MTTYRLVLIFILVLSTHSWGEVWTTPYYADGVTPVPLRDPNVLDVYVDILVGTRLSIVVSSDDNAITWNGRLTVKAPDVEKGQVWPCDYNMVTYNERESCSILPAAWSVSGRGRQPIVNPGFTPAGDLYVAMQGAHDPNTGEWFVVDYHAISLGECQVFFTEFPSQFSPGPVPGGIPPVEELVSTSIFSHVQTRDFDENHVVDFSDFALMALQLENSKANDPNMPIDPNDLAPEYDFDQNQTIDMMDLSMFMDFWLERLQ